MKLSQREAVLLFLLAIVAVVFVGVNILIKPAIASNKEKQATLEDLNQKLVQINSDVKLLDTIDENISEQYERALASSEPFSKPIDQIAIDSYISKLIRKNLILQTSIKISQIEVSNADFYSSRSDNIVDMSKLDVPIKQSADIINGSAGQVNKSSSNDTGGTNLMYCTTVNLAVTAKYWKILSFLHALYADGRALVIDEFKINAIPNDLYTKKATMTIRFFNAPEIKTAD